MSQQVLGSRYRLLSVIGSGGFGQVWRAYDENLRVEVAVKQIRPDPAASESERAALIARAEREARNAVRLRDHPNIVTVYDVVAADGAPWLVMRLVKGRSLAEELQARGRIPVEEAVRVAAGILSALSAAHAARVIHRDVKPGNILLAEDGSVLLADFGIAKHDTDTAQTRGAIVGSLPYVAPERLNGLDLPAGDLFALGVTLYEALEGISPFAREKPVEVMGAVALAVPAEPRNAGHLSGLILALMEKDPSRRPDAQGALASLTARNPERVRTVRSTAPTQTSPSPLPPGGGPPAPAAARPARRLPLLAWLGGAAIVLVISILIYSQLSPSGNRASGGPGPAASSSRTPTAPASTAGKVGVGLTPGRTRKRADGSDLAGFYVGTWQGTVNQENNGVVVGEANIVLVLTSWTQGQQAGTLSVSVGALSCTGDLTLTSVAGNGTATLYGRATGGECIDFDVTLAKTGSSSISYNTHAANVVSGVTESGTLTRS